MRFMGNKIFIAILLAVQACSPLPVTDATTATTDSSLQAGTTKTDAQKIKENSKIVSMDYDKKTKSLSTTINSDSFGDKGQLLLTAENVVTSDANFKKITVEIPKGALDGISGDVIFSISPATSELTTTTTGATVLGTGLSFGLQAAASASLLATADLVIPKTFSEAITIGLPIPQSSSGLFLTANECSTSEYGVVLLTIDATESSMESSICRTGDTERAFVATTSTAGVAQLAQLALVNESSASSTDTTTIPVVSEDSVVDSSIPSDMAKLDPNFYASSAANILGADGKLLSVNVAAQGIYDDNGNRIVFDADGNQLTYDELSTVSVNILNFNQDNTNRLKILVSSIEVCSDTTAYEMSAFQLSGNTRQDMQCLPLYNGPSIDADADSVKSLFDQEKSANSDLDPSVKRSAFVDLNVSDDLMNQLFNSDRQEQFVLMSKEIKKAQGTKFKDIMKTMKDKLESFKKLALLDSKLNLSGNGMPPMPPMPPMPKDSHSPGPILGGMGDIFSHPKKIESDSGVFNTLVIHWHPYGIYNGEVYPIISSLDEDGNALDSVTINLAQALDVSDDQIVAGVDFKLNLSVDTSTAFDVANSQIYLDETYFTSSWVDVLDSRNGDYSNSNNSDAGNYVMEYYKGTTADKEFLFTEALMVVKGKSKDLLSFSAQRVDSTGYCGTNYGYVYLNQALSRSGTPVSGLYVLNSGTYDENWNFTEVILPVVTDFIDLVNEGDSGVAKICNEDDLNSCPADKSGMVDLNYQKLTYDEFVNYTYPTCDDTQVEESNQ